MPHDKRPEDIPCEASEDGMHHVEHRRCISCGVQIELEERDEAYERAAAHYDGKTPDWR